MCWSGIIEMNFGLGGSLMLGLVMVVTITKWSSISGSEAVASARAQLLKDYPEVHCKEAKFFAESASDGPLVYRIKGNTSCVESLRNALEARGYERGTRFGEWQLEDGYRRPDKREPNIMFSFRRHSQTVVWIREWQ
jgi:hypothetical protein